MLCKMKKKSKKKKTNFFSTAFKNLKTKYLTILAKFCNAVASKYVLQMFELRFLILSTKKVYSAAC